MEYIKASCVAPSILEGSMFPTVPREPNRHERSKMLNLIKH